MGALQGRRILLVEDELLIAVAAVEELQDHGAVVEGPYETVQEALAAASEATLDAAILDVNLRGEQIDPVAEKLAERGIPFVIVSGNADAKWMQFPRAALLDKPYDPSELIAAVNKVINS